METISYKNHTIKINYDMHKDNPIEWNDKMHANDWQGREAKSYSDMVKEVLNGDNFGFVSFRIREHSEQWLHSFDKVTKEDCKDLVIDWLASTDSYSGATVGQYMREAWGKCPYKPKGQHFKTWVIETGVHEKSDCIAFEDFVEDNAEYFGIIEPIYSESLADIALRMPMFDDYIRGNVYDYIVNDVDGNQVDSCGGFYGYEHEKTGLLEHARDSIDYNANRIQKKKQLKQKEYIKNNVPLLKRI